MRDKLESGTKEFIYGEFIDGPMFFYNREMGVKVTMSLCQKPDEEEMTISADECPWQEESDLWEIGDSTFTAGASRPLKEFHELKYG